MADKMTSIRFAVVAIASLLGFACGLASAQTFPAKPVQIIVPFAPSGSTSIVFRSLAPQLQAYLGQPVVIMNRPGGGASIGMNAVAKASPDGYTLGVATLSFAANPGLLGSQMPYDTEKDLVPVAMVARFPLVLTINPAVPARSVKELIALARAKPGNLNYGSAGIASSGHLAGALFASAAGIELTHVPYSSTGSAGGLVAGQTQLQIAPIPSALGHIKAGRVVALGVTMLTPVATLAGVPPIAEAGVPGFEVFEWAGVVAPAGTPAAVIARLHQDITKSLADPEVEKRIGGVGAQVAGSTPEEFGKHIRKELTTWAKVTRKIAAEKGTAK